jgi:hypothetical protein
MIPQYTRNIKGFIAKRSRKMKKEGTYSDFGAIGKYQMKYVHTAEAKHRATEYARYV